MRRDKPRGGKSPWEARTSARSHRVEPALIPDEETAEPEPENDD